MSAKSVGAHPEIRIDGMKLTPDADRMLSRAVIESDLYAPDACRLSFVPDPKTLSGPTVDVGAKIEVHAAPPGSDTPEPIFAGVVFAVEGEYSAAGMMFTVVAYDASYPLFNSVATKVYPNQTASDVVRRVCSEVGLQVTVDSTSQVHEQVLRFGETAYDFIMRLARDVGFEFVVEGRKAVFRKATAAKSQVELTPGQNLESLRTRVTAAGLVTAVSARGWDVAKQEDIEATEQVAGTAASLSSTPKALASKVGARQSVVSNVPFRTTAECKAAAEAEAERAGSSFAYVEGIAQGDPNIVAGAGIKLKGLERRFEGQYVVTYARHEYTARGYRTHFRCSGRHDRSGAVPTAARPESRSIPGVMVGVVDNLDDPKKEYRVRVRLPMADEKEGMVWARVAVAGAGNGRGLSMMPEVGDEVLVACEHGDPRSMFVVGGLWNAKAKPPERAPWVKQARDTNTRGIRTRAGHELVFVDEQGKESIVLNTGKGGNKGTISVTLSEKDGVIIKTDSLDVKVESGKDLLLKSQGKMMFQATGAVEIKGSSVTVEGQSKTTIKGAQIELN